MRDFSQDHRWLSINTATVRKQQGAEVPLSRIIDQCAERSIRAISPWRDQVAAAVSQVATRAAELATGRAPDAATVQSAVTAAMESAGSR